MMANEWCDTCGHEHGPLYICEHYDAERKARIQDASDKWIDQLSNPKWLQEQIDKGVPPLVLGIFQCFAGLVPADRDGGNR